MYRRIIHEQTKRLITVASFNLLKKFNGLMSFERFVKLEFFDQVPILTIYGCHDGDLSVVVSRCLYDGKILVWSTPCMLTIILGIEL